MLTAVDLFAGLGGNSEGARQAGVHVVRAANHWELAVRFHKENHPETEHDCQDLHQANFFEWPDFDIMLASPCCQGFAKARGKDKPQHDASRSTAWAVIACAEAKRPSFIMVENVPEFTQWNLFPQWRSCLEALGYVLHVNILDAADFGVPQHRVRLFLTGSLRDISKQPVVIPSPARRHVPVSKILRWDEGNWSPIDKPGRSKATLKRIANGRAGYGDRFVAPYYGSGSGETGRSIERPLGTVTTRDRWAAVNKDVMRMLTIGEYRDCMGFPRTTHLPEVRRDAIHLLGNAVVPAIPKAVCEVFQDTCNN
jgi:DNA (cytosine-5)-methyltransferase 1